MSWIRVSRKMPCRICQKPDWCLAGSDGEWACCMRVVSERPFKFADGSEGYLHRVNGEPIAIPERHEEPAPFVDFQRLLEGWLRQTPIGLVRQFAKSISVTYESLVLMSAAWAVGYGAWAFPMKDGFGNTIGIRLRKPDGSKFAVRGSHQGLFVPRCEPEATCYIAEGPTDVAALLSMKVYAIGRPNCSGGVNHMVDTIKRLGIKRCVVCADNDGPGMHGGVSLTDHLPVPSVVITLPCKDMREYVGIGGDRDLLESLYRCHVWRQPHNSIAISDLT